MLSSMHSLPKHNLCKHFAGLAAAESTKSTTLVVSAIMKTHGVPNVLVKSILPQQLLDIHPLASLALRDYRVLTCKAFLTH
jgi:hypothetical protein